MRPFEERDLVAGEKIFREAFGAARGAADPARYWQDRNYVRSRWTADPGGAWVAVKEGAVAGIAMAARWGVWECSVRSRLTHSFGIPGLLGSYWTLCWRAPECGTRDYRFYPQQREAWPTYDFISALSFGLGLWFRFSQRRSVRRRTRTRHRVNISRKLRVEQKSEALKECAVLADTAYEGLEVSDEIRSVDRPYATVDLLFAPAHVLAHRRFPQRVLWSFLAQAGPDPMCCVPLFARRLLIVIENPVSSTASSRAAA